MKPFQFILLSATTGIIQSSTAAAQEAIPGYAYGQPTLAQAPYTMSDLAALQKTMLFSDEDIQALRQSKAVLADQTDAILDVWYGFVASTPELLVYFSDAKTGQADPAYLVGLTMPITTTLKPFLANKGASAADIEKMHAAWVKAVLLQVILWSQPYIREGAF